MSTQPEIRNFKIAIIGDVLGNCLALNAFLKHLESGITLVVCAGNLLGPGPMNALCQSIATRQRFIWVKGNYEESLVNPTVMAALPDWEQTLLKKYRLTMPPSAIKQLEDMNRTIKLEYFDNKIVVGHKSILDSPTNQNSSYMTRVILDEFGALDRIYDRANILILGNNRFPIYFSNSGQHLERMACDQIGRVFYLDERKKYFVNPGSLSQNECTDIPGTFTYAILHFNDDVVSLKFRRGKYDLNAYLKELETRGYPTQYINNFRIGG